MSKYQIDFMLSYPQIKNEGFIYLKTKDNELITAVYHFIQEQTEAIERAEISYLPNVKGVNT